MKDIGIIRDNTSSFAFPVVLVKKNNGSWRLYVDYRHLNRFSIKDKFHIPFVEELLDELVRACYFSKIYLKLRYHQIWMHKSNIHKTVFKTHHNHYELLVMSFGLINAPTFQSLMNHIFQPHLRRFVLVFFDDILVYLVNWSLHLQHIKVVFEVLLEHQLFIKLSKCDFGAT